MRSPIGRLVLAAILIAAGIVLWARGSAADRVAAAQRALATLHYAEAAASSETRAAAEYWRGSYEGLDGAADPFLAANAGYRAAMAAGGEAKAVVARLDGVVRQYVDVLRDDPAHEDAAFNHEFVVRLRNAIAARGGTLSPSPVPEGLTPHGRVGAPPSGGDSKQFKVIVPMRPDERREAEEAGQAGRRIRKG